MSCDKKKIYFVQDKIFRNEIIQKDDNIFLILVNKGILKGREQKKSGNKMLLFSFMHCHHNERNIV